MDVSCLLYFAFECYSQAQNTDFHFPFFISIYKAYMKCYTQIIRICDIFSPSLDEILKVTHHFRS